MNACGTFNALAWFLLAIPIIQLSWILSRGGKRQVAIHAAMACLALGGAVVEMLSKLLVVGGWHAANWISRDFNLGNWTTAGGDGMGWRALEVTFLVTEGALLQVLYAMGVSKCVFLRRRHVMHSLNSARTHTHTFNQVSFCGSMPLNGWHSLVFWS
jgi:hypothetical protein